MHGDKTVPCLPHNGAGQLDAERFRPSDQRAVIGNNRKLVDATAWQPEHSLDDTLSVIIEDWESREA